MALTRYEASRLKFCERQHVILKKRVETKLLAIKAKMDALVAAEDLIREDYEANLKEKQHLEAKRDAKE
jgi:hypothetical protein